LKFCLSPNKRPYRLLLFALLAGASFSCMNETDFRGGSAGNAPKNTEASKKPMKSVDQQTSDIRAPQFLLTDRVRYQSNQTVQLTLPPGWMTSADINTPSGMMPTTEYEKNMEADSWADWLANKKDQFTIPKGLSLTGNTSITIRPMMADRSKSPLQPGSNNLMFLIFSEWPPKAMTSEMFFLQDVPFWAQIGLHSFNRQTAKAGLTMWNNQFITPTVQSGTSSSLAEGGPNHPHQ
jgi:hypothetical protein